MFYQSTRAARHALLTTVSAAALVLVASGQAEAQNASPIWWLSVEGQYGWADGDAIDGFDQLSISGEEFAAGRLHLGGRLVGPWTAAIGLRYSKMNKERDSAGGYSSFNTGYSYEYQESNPQYSSFDAQGEYKEDHMVVDLEIGRDVGLGGSAQARIFGGVRFAKFDGEGKLSSNYVRSSNYSQFGGGSRIETDQRFSGAGPRIGIDARIPLTNNLRADVSVAGSALYGRRKIDVRDTLYSEFSQSESKNTIIPNVEASVALTYLLGSNASISLGYKAEQFWNIMPTLSGGEGGGFSNDDRLLHGPFARLTITGN
jgi:hypothetical protein